MLKYESIRRHGDNIQSFNFHKKGIQHAEKGGEYYNIAFPIFISTGILH
jgi:hypothetical protein